MAETPLGTFHFEKIKPEEMSLNPKLAELDAAQLQFPLWVRPWEQGDYFYPLGLSKKKKISRFLIDNKLSKSEKERIWVVESNKKIIWVCGLRIDHRFRVTEKTKEVLAIRLVAPE
jgi:tRNA(Ile)-lysidine synthase